MTRLKPMGRRELPARGPDRIRRTAADSDPGGGREGGRAGQHGSGRDAGLPPASLRGFPTPRQHTHAWFLVSGAQAATMFAKICGVDLRPGQFAPGRIAQTSVARLNAVIVRDDQGETLTYHVLVDSASAEYH